MLYAAVTHVVVAAKFLHNPYCHVDELVFAADLGLLLGSPLFTPHLHKLIEALTMWHKENYTLAFTDLDLVSSKRIPVLKCTSKVNVVPVHHQPSVLEFYSSSFLSQSPVVLTDCLNAWPAFSLPERNWQDINYLLQGTSLRLLHCTCHCCFEIRDVSAL